MTYYIILFYKQKANLAACHLCLIVGIQNGTNNVRPFCTLKNEKSISVLPTYDQPEFLEKLG